MIALARRANVIVNFNIESLTSRILGAGLGSYAIKHLQLPEVTRLVGPNYWWNGGRNEGEPNYSPRISIYHPHGTLEAGGLCILTREDYTVLNGTLAFQLAAHAAFGEELVIVGMSLDDRYLREQLLVFREYTRGIRWIMLPSEQAKLRAEVSQWVTDCGVQIQLVESREWFWRPESLRYDGFDDKFTTKEALLTAWLQAVIWACENDADAVPLKDPAPTPEEDLLVGMGASVGTALAADHPRWVCTGEPLETQLHLLARNPP